MGGSLWSCCQHSLGTHKLACERSARGSHPSGTQGRRAAGSQLTLTHQLGTQWLVWCCAVQGLAPCSKLCYLGTPSQAQGNRQHSTSRRAAAPVQHPHSRGEVLTAGQGRAGLLALLLGVLSSFGKARSLSLRDIPVLCQPLTLWACCGVGNRESYTLAEAAGVQMPTKLEIQIKSPIERCWGASNQGHTGVTHHPGTDKLDWHSKEKESDRAL